MSPADSAEARVDLSPEAAAAEEIVSPPPSSGWLRRLRWPLMIGAVALVLVVGFFVYLTGGRYQSTDDAQVVGARVQVSSTISGRVVTVAVHEGQLVHAGQLLFQLDGRPYQQALAEAQANLAQARLNVEALKTTYQQRVADLKAAQDSAAYLNGEAARQRALVAAGVATAAQAAQAENQAVQAHSQIAAAQAQVANALAPLNGNPNLAVDDAPTVKEAAARVGTAAINQGYVDVVASQEGVVTKVDQLQVGDYINASQPVFSLVSPHFWVEANFKENQLEYMRPGQSATLKLDAYPHLLLPMRVSSISPGTGSSFSLLPAENATGNWVKVTQRVPVRLDFVRMPDIALASGLSATVKVDTGHVRHLFGDASR
ncbi:MAG TPA: HlyD family secretion protein [Caulobacteraceae bacterium]|jgi:membrane fusion protein (multidrug efflux system)|nr:HlyD family secretion protein [Caulobacteraceae bacterium]